MKVGYDCAEEDLQWAGLSCDPSSPCAVYLELSAVSVNERKLIAGGNLHADSATLATILLESDDAGATWNEPVARTRGNAIEQVQFYDGQHAWAAGETQYPLARDPFVLAMAEDGWKQRPVGEEGNAGSVQRFWFDSPVHGEVVVDRGKAAREGRYASYESADGGESWKAQGASDQPPLLQQAPTSEPDWRVHPSADGKAWRIEKRDGGTWSAVASFLIDVASCKPEAAHVSEPPQ